MVTSVTGAGEVKVLDGNRAAAYGVLLCKPDVISAYPITPQTPIVETLWKFCADGILDAEVVAAEGEHSVMSVLIGAASAGARTFTATSSQGLAFMYEAYFSASGLRLPIIMAVATREMINPPVVASGQQDVIAMRDAGWVQLHCESCQEILDSIIMAYRLAEDPEVLLPVNVCFDGYYLSHLSEKVELPSPDKVNAFLPPHRRRKWLDPAAPLTFPSVQPGVLFTEYRFKHCAASMRAKEQFDEIDSDFGRVFGRSYGGQIEQYRTQDSEVVLVAMGSCAGTAKVVVDRKRGQGMKIGLVRVRMMRPFPREKLARALAGKKAVGVIDRNVCFGWAAGTVFVELNAALNNTGTSMPVISFIDGLAGLDITEKHIETAADVTWRAGRGEPFKEVMWLGLE